MRGSKKITEMLPFQPSNKVNLEIDNGRIFWKDRQRHFDLDHSLYCYYIETGKCVRLTDSDRLGWDYSVFEDSVVYTEYHQKDFDDPYSFRWWYESFNIMNLSGTGEKMFSNNLVINSIPVTSNNKVLWNREEDGYENLTVFEEFQFGYGLTDTLYGWMELNNSQNISEYDTCQKVGN